MSNNSNFKDNDGINHIKNLKMELNNEISSNTYIININNFETLYKHNENDKFITHNIYDGSKIKKKRKNPIGLNLFSRKNFF